MPWLVATFTDPVVVTTFTAGDGKVYRSRPTADETPQHVEITLPSGYQVLGRKPTSVTYRGRSYWFGHGSANLMFDEDWRALRQGIVPPTQVPVLAAGAGTGITASCRVAIAFYDEVTAEFSPISGWSNTVALTNQNRATTNIQTTAEARVTHVALIVEVDGATPRIATMRQLGVASITENVATLALGDAFSDDFERMPQGTIGSIYHERLCVAGNAHNPDVLYVSDILEPERYGGRLSFKTRNGEPIVAMAPSGLAGVLLVMTPSRPYVLRGWTEDDMVFEPLPYRIGAFNPHSVREVEGNVWVVGPDSIFLFNGSFHNVLRDRETEWQTEVKAYRAFYEAGFCAHDPNDKTFMFITSGYTSTPSWLPNPDAVTVKTIAWTCDYSSTQPEASGGFTQPDWFVDAMQRDTASAGLLTLPNGRRSDLYIGGCDGYARYKDATDDDDDSDTYVKNLWIRPPHYLMSDPGGDYLEGKSLIRLWSYVESEDDAWILYIRGGDEKAYLQQLPDNDLYWWKDSVAASAKTESLDSYLVTYAAKTVHIHLPNRVSGRGFTFDYHWAAPVGVRFAGLGGQWSKGPAARGVVTRVLDA